MRTLRRLFAAVLLAPSLAHAHSTAEAAQGRGELLLVVLFLAGVWYLIGFFRVRAGARNSRAALGREALLFLAGWVIIAGSLLSPLHELGARSFTAHMIEHELLMLGAAPLIAWSRPLGVLLWALPSRVRRWLASASTTTTYKGIWTTLSAPVSASLLQAAMLWLWHAPLFFDRALDAEGWHMLQHLSLLFSALLFWWSMNKAATQERHHGAAAFWLFFTSIHSGLLGALMSLAQSPWYEGYVRLGLHGAGSLSPLEDQQLAGIIMWIPGGLVHAAVAMWYLSRWLNRTGVSQQPGRAKGNASEVLP